MANGPASPAWVRVADLITIALLCAAAWVAITGGVRTSLMGARISVTSLVRLVVLAVIVTTLRHAIHRRPSLPEWARSLTPYPRPLGWGPIIRVWAVSRLGVIAVGYFAVLTIGLSREPPFQVWKDNVFLNLPARWDAGWYLEIASNGYRWSGTPSRQANIAFFPAFPFAMGVGGGLLGAFAPRVDRTTRYQRLLIAGWLVALGAFFWALVYVYRWSDARAGPTVALTTITLLAAYPFALFFSAPYSEPVYLLATAAAFVHVERAEWVRAGVWAFVVGLARPSGVLLIIPLAWIVLREWATQSRVPRPAVWLVLLAPVAAAALHIQHLKRVTGEWFAWSEIQAAWGRTYEISSWLDTGLAEIAADGVMRYVEASPVTVLNGLAALMALVLLWRLTTVAGLAYTLFVLVNLVPALASGGFMSVGRFTSTLFPLFFALAISVREQHVAVWVLGFGMLQGLLAVLFFTWRPLV